MILNLSKALFIGTTLIFLSLTAINCSLEQENSDLNLSEVERMSIDSLKQIVGPNKNQEISSPSDIDMTPDGRLAVMDTDQFQVLLIHSDGTIEKSFGRRGKGPGEFVAPRGVNVNGTTINVMDVGLQRVSQYDLNGNFIQNYPLERETSHFGFVTTGANSEFYSVANGYNGKLVAHYNAATDSFRYFGEAPVEDPPPVDDHQSFRSSASNGEVPEAIHNDIWMDYQKGDLYVFLKNLSRLQKYTEGTLEWEKELWLPANDIIFDNFAENARQSGFGVLRYIEDLTATDNYVYLLWNGTSEHPQTIVQVDTQGEIQTLYSLPKSKDQHFSNIAVDPANNRLYLSDSRAAEIYTVDI